MRKLMMIGVVLGMTVATASASLTFSFTGITNNNAGNPGLGEGQLRMTVSDVGGNVQFDFFHDGLVDMSITQIYFDDLDTPLLSFLNLIDADDNAGDPGVDYSPNGAPPTLPGGNNASPAFVTSYYYTADAAGGVEANGVNPTELLSIVFSGSYADVIDALLDGSLRVGLHVQAIDGPLASGSESFVNNGVIPAPGAALLGFVGLAVTTAAGRRWIG